MNFSNVVLPFPAQEPGNVALNETGSQSSVIRTGLRPSLAWLTIENPVDSTPITSAARMMTRTSTPVDMYPPFGVVGNGCDPLVFCTEATFIERRLVPTAYEVITQG